MVIHVHFEARVVGACEKGVTGSQARPENAYAAITLLLQPIDTGPGVYHSLPGRIDRPADVRGYRVVGAVQLRRHARIVIRQAQAQGRDAELPSARQSAPCC